MSTIKNTFRSSKLKPNCTTDKIRGQGGYVAN